MDEKAGDLDREDARRVLEGDTEAFGGIVRRWQGPLVNLAYRYCRDRARAEEMAQEAFLRAYRFLGRWRDDAPFSTWLFAIAINLYRSEVRRVKPRQVSLDDAPEPRAAGDPASGFEGEATAETVRRTVTALPEKYRDAVILFYFEGMDVTEASKRLGVPEGTVKARLHRARGMLEKKLLALLRPRRPAAAEATR